MTIVVSFCISCTKDAGEITVNFNYPETSSMKHVDTYHDVEVGDPYRWLEEDVRESEDVSKWVMAQNEVILRYIT